MAESEYTTKACEKVLDIINNYDYSKGTVLFHCKTGKDRTGIIAALILKSHGYSIKSIEKDYTRSNKCYRKTGIAAYAYFLAKYRNEKLAKEVKHFFIMNKRNIDLFIK